jgi:hypothetical protein
LEHPDGFGQKAKNPICRQFVADKLHSAKVFMKVGPIQIWILRRVSASPFQVTT